MTKLSFVSESLIFSGAYLYAHNIVLSYIMISFGILSGILRFIDDKNEKKESRENTLQLIATSINFISSLLRKSYNTSGQDEEETKH